MLHFYLRNNLNCNNYNYSLGVYKTHYKYTYPTNKTPSCIKCISSFNYFFTAYSRGPIVTLSNSNQEFLVAEQLYKL